MCLYLECVEQRFVGECYAIHLAVSYGRDIMYSNCTSFYLDPLVNIIPNDNPADYGVSCTIIASFMLCVCAWDVL